MQTKEFILEIIVLMMDILEPENDLLGELVQFYNGGSWGKVVDNATKLLRQYPLSINLLNIGAAHSKWCTHCKPSRSSSWDYLFQPVHT